MCGIEPSKLAEELPGLRIGRDSVNWYQDEIDRYQVLADEFLENVSRYDSNDTEAGEQGRNKEYTKLLIGFSEPFLQR